MHTISVVILSNKTSNTYEKNPTEKHLILKGESDLPYKYFSFVNDDCSGCMRRQVNCMWYDLLHSSSH